MSNGDLSGGLVLLIVGVLAALATLSGGLLALMLRQRIHLILGFSAGAVVAVALLELLPEAFKIGAPLGGPEAMATFVAMGFLLYLVADRLLSSELESGSSAQGHLGAASLTTHSLLDGLAIGLAFQASEAIGLVVAAAVMAHDFADGINTVNLSLVGAAPRAARRWLVADALAPLAGISITTLLHFPEDVLAPALAMFAGAFLYIGAGKLISESYRRHPYIWTTLTSAVGFGLIYVAVTVSRE